LEAARRRRAFRANSFRTDASAPNSWLPGCLAAAESVAAFTTRQSAIIRRSGAHGPGRGRRRGDRPEISEAKTVPGAKLRGFSLVPLRVASGAMSGNARGHCPSRVIAQQIGEWIIRSSALLEKGPEPFQYCPSLERSRTALRLRRTGPTFYRHREF
jgi:hypothetical protein